MPANTIAYAKETCRSATGGAGTSFAGGESVTGLINQVTKLPPLYKSATSD